MTVSCTLGAGEVVKKKKTTNFIIVILKITGGEPPQWFLADHASIFPNISEGVLEKVWINIWK